MKALFYSHLHKNKMKEPRKLNVRLLLDSAVTAYHLQRLFLYDQIQALWCLVRDDVDSFMHRFEVEEDIKLPISYYDYANHSQHKWSKKVLDVLEISIKRLRAANGKIKFFKAVPGIPKWLIQLAENDEWDYLKFFDPAVDSPPVQILIEDPFKYNYELSEHYLPPSRPTGSIKAVEVYADSSKPLKSKVPQRRIEQVEDGGLQVIPIYSEKGYYLPRVRPSYPRGVIPPSALASRNQLGPRSPHLKM